MDNSDMIKPQSTTSNTQTPVTESAIPSQSPISTSLPPTNGAALSPSTPPSSLHPSPPANNDATTKVTRPLSQSMGIYIKAYIASLLTVGIVMPVVASLLAVGLYLASNSPIPLLGLQPSSPWYVLLYSSLLTGILWLVAAIPFCSLCTAQGANSRNYSLLQSRLHQLKVTLGMKDYADGSYEEINAIEAVMNHAGFHEHNKHQREVLKDVYACCIDISRKLYKSPAGLPWIIGTAYNSVWTLLHHAEEAMIEVQDVETVVRGAKHDFLAIEGSKMNGQDELLDNVIQAVAVLKPEALVYFREHQPAKSGGTLSQLTQLIHQPAASPLAAQASGKNDANPDVRSRAESAARATLREVRSTLNDFRDQRWEGIVRQRSRLMMSIAVTGIVTHALLCVIILTNPPPAIHINILAAAMFYMVGAVSGIFVRFYAESQGGTSVDDFGLSTTRLMAIPLLSGLAGVGGVFAVGGLAVLGEPALFKVSSPQSMTFDLSKLFSPDPQFLLAAAIFGVTPNLLIKGLQKKANEYETDLKSSKAGETQARGAKS